MAGHIAFSPVTVSDGSQDWYGLGPISVLPELQRRGIGKALLGEWISRLKTLGERAVSWLATRDITSDSASEIFRI